MKAERAEVPLTRCLELAQDQHGLFTFDQARQRGASKAMLYRACQAKKISRHLPRVYAVGGVPTTWKQRVMGLCLWADGAASHETAAALWRLDGCKAGLLSVLTEARRDPPFPGAAVHQVKDLPACDVTEIDGLPVTTTTRTLLDLAGRVDDEALELALEDALRRRLTSVPRLRWQLQRMGRPGRSGAARLRRVLTQRGYQTAPTESALETGFARWLRTTALPPPVRQLPVANVRIDFAYPDQKVAIEVDGYRFHSGRMQWYRDRAKTKLLRSLGWTVISVAKEDLAVPTELELEIARALGLSLL